MFSKTTVFFSTGAVASICKVGECGRGCSKERVESRSFLRKLSPAPAPHPSDTKIRDCAVFDPQHLLICVPREFDSKSSVSVSTRC